jgi:hypothetical protein
MKDYIELGSTPTDEQCAQLGKSDDYDLRAAQECAAYINQLWRILELQFALTRDSNPYQFSLVRKSNRHDFGTYYEVAVRYDDNDKHAVEVAFWLDGNTPNKWDDEARKELGL